jgi:hypothetical protein
VADSARGKEEIAIAVKPDVSKIKPLKKVRAYEGRFPAIDCSTRTVKRANNWGVYLMRPCFVVVKGRNVRWGYTERITTIVGDAYIRGDYLEDIRVELESQTALEQIHHNLEQVHDGNTDSRGNYVLPDGGGYFGGGKKFRVTLYEECQSISVTLLALSKRSAILHDEKGRDFMVTTGMLAPFSMWVYPSIK